MDVGACIFAGHSTKQAVYSQHSAVVWQEIFNILNEEVPFFNPSSVCPVYTL
jgi:hypothetical protein